MKKYSNEEQNCDEEYTQQLKILNSIKSTDNVEIKEDQLIYNSKNIQFTMNDCLNLFNKFDIKQKPHDINLYQQAFIDASYTVKKNQNFTDGNQLCPKGCFPLWENNYERLEFIGDSIYNSSMCHYIFERYNDQNEGFLRTTQAYLSKQLGFDKFLVISSDFEKRHSRNNTKLLKDIFEAFIGAMYIDFNLKPSLNLEQKGYYPFQGFGFQIVQKFVMNVCEEYIDIGELLIQEHDYVDEFTKLYRQKHKEIGGEDCFKYQGQENRNGENLHVYVVKDNGRPLAHGYGKTQKDAKRDCARKALEFY